MTIGRGPLAGVRVFDISQAGVGPWSTSLLGRMGADIIKAEPPSGDRSMRRWPQQGGVSTTYLEHQHNKRGIVLDLKQEEDRARAYKIIAHADVFVENFRPGVVKRLGVDYNSVSKVNPQIVYMSA